jgi:hypothetical protein
MTLPEIMTGMLLPKVLEFPLSIAPTSFEQQLETIMYNLRLTKLPLSRLLLIVFCSLSLTSFLAAQSAAEAPDTAGTHLTAVYPVSLSIYPHPGCAIPLADNAKYFGIGGAIALDAGYDFRGHSQLLMAGGRDYALLPVKDKSSHLSLLAVPARGGIYSWLTPRPGVEVTEMGGYYLGFLSDSGGSSGRLALETGAQLAHLLNPGPNLTLGAACRCDLGTFQGLAITASASCFLRGTEGCRVAIERAERYACPGGTADAVHKQILIVKDSSILERSAL